jgi:hypothetical protein
VSLKRLGHRLDFMSFKTESWFVSLILFIHCMTIGSPPVLGLRTAVPRLGTPLPRGRDETHRPNSGTMGECGGSPFNADFRGRENNQSSDNCRTQR